MRFFLIIIAVVYLLTFTVSFSDDGDDEDIRFELEEIVVTGVMIEDPIKAVPRNVTVITRFDIEQAPSKNIIDLLSREANVNLRSLFGHDKRSGVDIRGMGDTSSSNVIVMVDGIRLNAPDLAGPDLSAIPLDQIERIEIVRGAGSVLYGDGAVGGVINIITKKREGKTETDISTSYGSYNTLTVDTLFRKKEENIGFGLTAGYYSSEGYRDNGFYKRKDASVTVDYDLTETTSLSFTLTPHTDSYGLPGTVSKEDVSSREQRVMTDRPDDSGENTDMRFLGGLETYLGDFGLLQAKAGYHFRDDFYVMGYSPLLTREEQTDHIDEDTLDVNVKLSAEYELFKQLQKLQGGIDYSTTLYKRVELSKDERKNSSIHNLGAFLMNQLSPIQNLTLNLGYRLNMFQGDFRVDQYKDAESIWEDGEPYQNLWINHAFDAGLVYSLTQYVTFYASFATSFRIPNVDELAVSDSDLHPQEGNHWEAGSRISVGDFAELSLTFFLMQIKDEIYYGEDPETGTPVNRNYEDKTNRIGIETDVKLYPFDFLYIWGNYTFMDARFENRWTLVPLVPMHKASFGLEWQISDAFLLAISGSYVGERFDGNDETNTLYAMLPSYTVIDSKLSYQHEDLTLFIGMNNIFDELYSTAAYGESYYPMPTRNFYGGAELEF
ncbi:MAG: TonB-dependent receptor [Spirochaetota bacterium]|nr:MAG: TonB-dependent receptor [Spirochaetota bacterium]